MGIWQKLFIDHEKDFDSITQSKMCECLNRLEINNDIIGRIKQAYVAYLQVTYSDKDFFEVEMPLHYIVYF